MFPIQYYTIIPMNISGLIFYYFQHLVAITVIKLTGFTWKTFVNIGYFKFMYRLEEILKEKKRENVTRGKSQ